MELLNDDDALHFQCNKNMMKKQTNIIEYDKWHNGKKNTKMCIHLRLYKHIFVLYTDIHSYNKNVYLIKKKKPRPSFNIQKIVFASA